MIGILVPIVKTVASMLLSNSVKNLVTSKKSNDIVSKISNQSTGMIVDKG